MTRETVARELAGVLKALDHLKRGRAASQSEREQVVTPAELGVKMVLAVIGYTVDENGNPVDQIPQLPAEPPTEPSNPDPPPTEPATETDPNAKEAAPAEPPEDVF